MTTSQIRALTLAAACMLVTDIASAQYAQDTAYGGYPTAIPSQNVMQCPPGYAMRPHRTAVPPQRRVIDQRVYAAPGYRDENSPIESFLTTVAKRSWVRFDYLLWELRKPGNVPLGADVADPADPTVPFPVISTDDGIARLLGVVPTLDDFSLNNISGVRGTLGTPFDGGHLELSFWGLDRKVDELNFPDLQAGRGPNLIPPGNPPLTALGTVASPNIVTTLLLNGSPLTTSLLVYDKSFEASLTSRMWGTEINVFQDYQVPWKTLRWEPMIGFSFLNLRETLTQQGVFDNGGVPPIGGAAVIERTTRIVSRATNNIYGPQIGARATLQLGHFSLSATPRVAFALNDYVAIVDTGEITTAALTIPATREREERIDFTPVVQLSLAARVHINDICSMYAAYDWMWIHRLTRPYDNINYDSSLNPFIPEIGLKTDLDEMNVHGFSIGVEIRLP